MWVRNRDEYGRYEADKKSWHESVHARVLDEDPFSTAWMAFATYFIYSEPFYLYIYIFNEA